jgi:hypothetical protein
MRRRTRVAGASWLFVLLLGLILPCPGPAAGPREAIEGALRNGMGVVLVVVGAGHPDPADEAYGDWANYLNNFSSRADPAVRIVKTTAAEYRRIIAAPALKDEFATLFIRDPAHTLQYDGMILEPQIYLLGQNYALRRGDFTPRTGYGLRQTAVQLR